MQWNNAFSDTISFECHRSKKIITAVHVGEKISSVMNPVARCLLGQCKVQRPSEPFTHPVSNDIHTTMN